MEKIAFCHYSREATRTSSNLELSVDQFHTLDNLLHSSCADMQFSNVTIAFRYSSAKFGNARRSISDSEPEPFNWTEEAQDKKTKNYIAVLGIPWAANLWGLAGETLASGWGSFWKRSSFGSSFSLLSFRDVFGADPRKVELLAPKQTRRAWRNRPIVTFVLLNSWANFFVSLGWIFSDTWLIESSRILGTFVSRAEVFVRCSSWFSLLIAENFCVSSGLPFSVVEKIPKFLEDSSNFIERSTRKLVKLAS